MAYYLYTETAFHHQGEIEYLRKLIDASKEVGANGVKFQVLLDYDSLMSQKHSGYNDFKKGLLSKEEWEQIFIYTNSLGLDIIFMPICIESFSLLNSDKYKINFLDIHSVSYYHEDLHKRIKESGIPVILGIGGRDLEEIKDRINYFGDQLSVLMVGFQSYPSKIENLKIEKIRLLNQLFPKVNIGYADHSSFDSEYAVTSNEWAYILGARFFEKHIAIEEGKERWDFQSAVGVEKMNSIKSKLDFLDNHVFKYSETELTSIDNEELVYRNRQKIAVAIKDLPKGHVLTEEDLGLKMIDNTSGLNSKHLLIGKTLNFSVEQGAKILLEDVS